MPLALLALTISAFAIGTTEFVIVGLLPTLAADLHVSLPSAGLLVSLYALGVAIGAPVLTALTARLPRKTRAEQDAAMEELNCVHLGPNGCTVYEERPLICRLFGTTKTLPCPNGRGPVELIHPRVEKQIFEYMAANRQVLV